METELGRSNRSFWWPEGINPTELPVVCTYFVERPVAIHLRLAIASAQASIVH
jgi:hypothetical protein